MYPCMYNFVALKVCYHDVLVVIVPMPHDRGCEIKIIVSHLPKSVISYHPSPHPSLLPETGRVRSDPVLQSGGSIRSKAKIHRVCHLYKSKSFSVALTWSRSFLRRVGRLPGPKVLYRTAEGLILLLLGP